MMLPGFPESLDSQTDLSHVCTHALSMLAEEGLEWFAMTETLC